MKKITFLALHLGYGGIEKCISDVANLLSDDYEIEILSIYKIYDKEVFKLNNNIKITYLTNLKPNREEFKNSLKRFKLITTFKEGIKAIKILRLKKKVMIDAIKKLDSDIIISTRIFTNKLLGEYGKGYLIGWEHNHHNNDKSYQKEFMDSCKNLDKVILVSKSLKEDYEILFKENNIKCKCVFIPNFVKNIDNSVSNLNNNNLISVGRLSYVKGYDDLIDVFKIINEKNNNINLNIVGDGEERNNLQNKINSLNLSNKVKLHGFLTQDYINKLYDNSCIYLMTSLTESFGLVLVEAMSKGIVPIVFDSAQGAKDIIDNNINGFLIKNRNKEEMANLVLDLINDKNRLKELSNNAYIKSKNFSEKSTKKYWIDLLEEKK